MPDKKRRERKPEQGKRLVRFDPAFFERQEPERLRTITEDRRSGGDGRDILDPVKFTESDEMVIVPMGPDYCVNTGRSVQEQLLAKIR